MTKKPVSHLTEDERHKYFYEELDIVWMDEMKDIIILFPDVFLPDYDYFHHTVRDTWKLLEENFP